MKKTTYILASFVMIAAIACRKESPIPVINPAVTVNSTPQFVGTINGTVYTYTNGITYTTSTSSSKQIGGTGATKNRAEFTSLIYDTSPMKPSLSIDKGTIAFPLGTNLPDTATFDAFFAPNTYSYSINDSNGVQIDWVDASGNVYNTSLGSGNQTGSSFTIVSKQVVGIDNGSYEVKIMAKFNCTLYNAAGNSILLTNGTYIGYFQNY